MVLSSWQSHCESSPSSFDERRLSAEVAANPQTKPTDLDLRESARKKWQLPSTSTIANFIITEPERWYSFYRPTECGRLSRLRHCGKAVCCSGCCDKHNCRRWDSNLGPLTPQSGMLPLGHCDTVMHPIWALFFMFILWYTVVQFITLLAVAVQSTVIDVSVFSLAFILKTMCPNFRKFSVHLVCVHGSFLIWRQISALCTSSFVDDIMFSQNGTESNMTVFCQVCQVAALGVEFAVYASMHHCWCSSCWV